MKNDERTFFRVFEISLIIGLIISMAVIFIYSFTPIRPEFIVGDITQSPLKILMVFGNFSLKILSYSMVAGGITSFASVFFIFGIITKKDGSLNTQWF